MPLIPRTKFVSSSPAEKMRSASPLSTTSADRSVAETLGFEVGDKVYLMTAKRSGVVKFVGTAHFAGGIWVGVELPDASGKNNGTVHGQRYFSCKAMHGLFVRPSGVTLVAKKKAPGVNSAEKSSVIKQQSGNPLSTPLVDKAVKIPTSDISTGKLKPSLSKDSSDTTEKSNRRIESSDETLSLLGRIDNALTRSRALSSVEKKLSSSYPSSSYSTNALTQAQNGSSGSAKNPQTPESTVSRQIFTPSSQRKGDASKSPAAHLPSGGSVHASSTGGNFVDVRATSLIPS